MNWYLGVLKKYGEFSGRARRKEYRLFSLFNLIIIVVLGFIDGAAGLGPPRKLFGPLVALYILAVLLPSIAVAVRRLHDTNHSGRWLFIGLIPLIGPIVLLSFMVRDSQKGQNPYGSNPKEATA
jgi:uncharacterized membrane protein YhaH (DUF805 family)